MSGNTSHDVPPTYSIQSARYSEWAKLKLDKNASCDHVLEERDIQATLYSYLNYDGMRKRGPRIRFRFTVFKRQIPPGVADLHLEKEIYILFIERAACFMQPKQVSRILRHYLEINLFLDLVRNEHKLKKKWLNTWKKLDMGYEHEIIKYHDRELSPHVRRPRNKGNETAYLNFNKTGRRPPLYSVGGKSLNEQDLRREH